MYSRKEMKMQPVNVALIVEKVNRAFNQAGFTIKVEDISEVERFLANEKNIPLGVYEVVEQLYSQLMEDIGI